VEQIEIINTASYEQNNPSRLLKYLSFDKFCIYLPLSVEKLALFYVLLKAGLLLIVAETKCVCVCVCVWCVWCVCVCVCIYIYIYIYNNNRGKKREKWDDTGRKY